MTEQATTIDELVFTRPYGEQGKQILVTEVVEFLTGLVTYFTSQRNKPLVARIQQQQGVDSGMLPNFISKTASIRGADWRIRGIPSDLEDHHVGIIGPVEHKMVISALNTNMKIFTADFENSLTLDRNKAIDGQINLRDVINGTTSYSNEADKIYQLKPNPAVLICWIYGLRLPEKHVIWRGETIPGNLSGFALYSFRNYQAPLVKGNGPCFYLSRVRFWWEAAWWSEVFSCTEDRFNLPRNTIKATLLIETLPAVFQMDEILHTLRDHIVGLDYGRRDYIFSYIKILKSYPDRVLPDRQTVTMDEPFLSAYSHLLIKICRKRDTFTMDDMAAFIPSRDGEHNSQALGKVKAGKSLEANDGHDDTWIAHLDLADTAMAVFNDILNSYKSQLEVMHEQDASIAANQLLAPCDGERTEEDVCANIRVAVQYIEARISGNGCVPTYGLTKDVAAAEISCTSIWQWTHHQKMLNNGKPMTKALFRQMPDEEMKIVTNGLGEERFSHGRPDDTVRLTKQIITSDKLIDFLTLPGYRLSA